MQPDTSSGQPPVPVPAPQQQQQQPIAAPVQNPVAVAPAPLPAPNQTPAAAPAAASDSVAKKIKGSADSAFWLGVLLAVILSLVGGSVALGAVQVIDPHKTAELVIIGLEVLLSIGMIIYGHRLKKLTADHSKALATMSMAMLLCGGILALSVIDSFLKRPANLSMTGVLSLVTLIYLAVRRGQVGKAV